MPRRVRDSALETRTARTRHLTRRCLALVSVPFRNNAKSLIKLLRNRLDAVSNPRAARGFAFSERVLGPLAAGCPRLTSACSYREL
jgi:hypothetical protein